ncbi:MAG: hypothetical protein MAG451_00026 [Anaerolineales bacterium]|nr:hypothetical protein [Anaerolineales bacterium]
MLHGLPPERLLRTLKIGIVGLLVAAMAGSVLAQEDTTTPDPRAYAFHGRGNGFGQGLCGETGLAAGRRSARHTRR